MTAAGTYLSEYTMSTGRGLEYHRDRIELVNDPFDGGYSGFGDLNDGEVMTLKLQPQDLGLHGLWAELDEQLNEQAGGTVQFLETPTGYVGFWRDEIGRVGVWSLTKIKAQA